MSSIIDDVNKERELMRQQASLVEELGLKVRRSASVRPSIPRICTDFLV
jgi:hypothetical protein